MGCGMVGIELREENIMQKKILNPLKLQKQSKLSFSNIIEHKSYFRKDSR
jgi:hypothetical protein